MKQMIVKPVGQLSREDLSYFVSKGREKNLLPPEAERFILTNYEKFSQQYREVQLGASLVDLDLIQVGDISIFLGSRESRWGNTSLVHLPSPEDVKVERQIEERQISLEKIFEEALASHPAPKQDRLPYSLTEEELERLRQKGEELSQRGFEVSLTALAVKEKFFSAEEVHEIIQSILQDPIWECSECGHLKKDENINSQGEFPCQACGEKAVMKRISQIQMSQGRDPWYVERDLEEEVYGEGEERPTPSLFATVAGQDEKSESPEILEEESQVEKVEPVESLETAEPLSDFGDFEDESDEKEENDLEDTRFSMRAISPEEARKAQEKARREALAGVEEVEGEEEDDLVEAPVEIDTADLEEEVASLEEMETLEGESQASLEEELAQPVATPVPVSKEEETKTSLDIPESGEDLPEEPPSFREEKVATGPPAFSEKQKKLFEKMEQWVTLIENHGNSLLEVTSHFEKEETTTTSELVPSTKKNKETGEKVEIDGKVFTVLAGAELEEALEKNKPIRSAYIESLRLPETSHDKKLKILNSYIGWCDLSEITFEKEVDFTGTFFREKPRMKKAVFQKKFLCRRATFNWGADFTEVTFEHECNFNGSRFERYVSFRKCDFQRRTVFAKVHFEGGGNFDRSEFGDEASFSESFANYRFTLTKVKFGGTVKFSNSEYKDMCDFSGSEFGGDVNYIRVQFYGPAKFSRTKYLSEVTFKGSYFLKDVFFHGTQFSSLTDFSGVQGEGNVFFQGMKPLLTTSFAFSHVNINRMFIERKQVEGHIQAHREKNWEQAARDYGILKTSFRDINSYSDEDWAYYMEKRTGRRTLPVGLNYPIKTIQRFFDWLALDVGCGYGTKPLNILFVSLAMIAFFAAFFMIFPESFACSAENMSSADFGVVASVVTSFKAFVGAEVGEWYPKADQDFMTLMIMLESFLGVFTMTVLVVTFSRKVIR